MTKPYADRALAWGVSILAGAATAYLACFPLMDTDIWWHLAAGRLMIHEHRFIYTDPFAVDTLGAPWVDVHWLFQVLVYLVHSVGGVAALVVAKVILIALGVALGVRAACTRLPRSWWLPLAAIVVAFLYPARHLMLARPTILTLLGLTTTLLVLDRVRRDHDLRWAALLLPIQILWANLQGLYLLGPGLVACMVVGDMVTAWLAPRASALAWPPVPPRSIRLGLALCIPAMILASAITPYGPRGLALPFVLLGRISSLANGVFAREVSENLAPWLMERTAPGELSGFKWLAALTFLSFMPSLRRGFNLGRFCLCIVFLALALTANRNLLLFLWLAGPIAAENLIGWARSIHALAPAWSRRGLQVASFAGMAALLLARTQEARGEPPITQLAPFRVPVEAADRLQALDLPPGPVFCSDRYGGYLSWRLGPRHRPTMDGRLVLRSGRDYAEHLALGEHPEGFEAYRQRHGIRTVLVPAAYPDRFLPLVVWLLRQPDWRLLYTDGTQTLFVHDPDGHHADQAIDLTTTGTVQVIDRELAVRYGSQPLVLHQARLHLARLAAEAGATGPAEEILAFLPGITAEALRARVAYRAGDLVRAQGLAEALLARVPNETESLCLLALLARDRGDSAQALGLLRRALAVDPFHPLARRLLDELASVSHSNE
jgi:hypothetical protein